MNTLRYELKYEISAAVLPLLRCRLRAVMQQDRHCGPSGYHIRSLYFDDPDRSAYLDKIDGHPERSKLRLRYYNLDPSYIVLENKEKLGNLTRKTGQIVSLPTAAALAAGTPALCTEKSGPVLDTYFSRGGAAGLRPAVMVDYRRTAFVYSVSNVRITLDEDICSGLYHKDLFDTQCVRIPVLDPGRAVLEVKFDRFLPTHLSAALADIPMVRLAISKYVKCLDVLD